MPKAKVAKEPALGLVSVELFELASVFTQDRFTDKHVAKMRRIMRLVQSLRREMFDHFCCPSADRLIVGFQAIQIDLLTKTRHLLISHPCPELGHRNSEPIGPL